MRHSVLDVKIGGASNYLHFWKISGVLASSNQTFKVKLKEANSRAKTIPEVSC